MNFIDIWQTNKDHLFSFIKSKIDDQDIANDILQEVSIKLIKKLNYDSDIQNHKAWLFQVARNTIADYFRNKKDHSASELDQSEQTINPTTCICDLSGFVIQKYLPEKYAIPLYLSDIEQKPQQEIANILDLSLTAAKSRIQRARKKLKELITECLEISFNERGQIHDFQLKKGCELPPELKEEIEKLNLIL